MKKIVLSLLVLLMTSALIFSGGQKEEQPEGKMAEKAILVEKTAICYNCPPMWADWASQLKAIEENLGIIMPHDNKNSGQTLSQLIAEKDYPVADVAYYGVTFGILAKEQCRSNNCHCEPQHHSLFTFSCC